MKVKLYVKAKSRGVIRAWLEENRHEFVLKPSLTQAYYNYFVLDRAVALQIKTRFPQRDMKIANM